MITQEILKQSLFYDPETGLFTRIGNSRLNACGLVGTVQNKGYRAISVRSKLYRAHRLAWLYVYGEFPTDQIDHINGNRDDNRIANLRVVNSHQNACNKRSPAGSNPHIGVTKKKRRNQFRWCARIMVNKKAKHLGYFNTVEEAKNAYILAKAQLHGIQL